jgi:hypothetical protein
MLNVTLGSRNYLLSTSGEITMEDGQASSPSNKVVPPVDGQVEPKPPKILGTLKWIYLYGRKHWGLVLVAFIITGGGWMVSVTSGLTFLQNATDLLVNRKIRHAINDLQAEYPHARDQLQFFGSGSFVQVERDINDILRLDPQNGHGLYYSGEVQRVTHPSLFTSKSRVIPEKLATYNGTLDAYENDFFRYIEIEKTVLDKTSKEDFSYQACYSHTSGYCAQRTAWINHLLANDLYQQAMFSSDLAIKRDRLQRALKYATVAAKYLDENRNLGFLQCTPTIPLISEARESLTNLESNQP